MLAVKPACNIWNVGWFLTFSFCDKTVRERDVMVGWGGVVSYNLGKSEAWLLRSRTA